MLPSFLWRRSDLFPSFPFLLIFFSMPRLIVNADDYGIGSERDRGIEHAFTHGCVTSGSLLLAGDSVHLFPQTSDAAMIPFGLHLNLTEGKPVSDVKAVPSLVGPDGTMHGKHGFRSELAAGRIDLKEVEAETEAQLRKFVELVGKKPSHIDSHQHIHVLPELVDVIALVLTRPEFGVTKMRCPEEDLSAAPWFAQFPTKDFYQTVSLQAKAAKPRYERYGIRFPDRFVGNAFLGGNNSVDRFVAMLAGIGEEETVEFMCHPGYQGSSWDDFNRSTDREHELSILCDARVRAALHNIELCSFEDL